MTRIAAAAALACAGCGNYSTEDLKFLSALPTREELRARVPADAGTAGAATVCGNPANAWLEAKTASDGWNAGVEFIIGLVDVVRSFPPDWRNKNERRWGPFPDEKHPGIEIQVYMTRDFPPELNGEPRYGYVFQARHKAGTDPWANLIGGVFEGPSSSRGKGFVGLDFEAFWTLGMGDPPDAAGRGGTPHGTAAIAYDRTTGEPDRIFFSLYDAQLASQFQYAFRGWSDGSGRFGYRFSDLANGYVFAAGASYGAQGEGRDVVLVTTLGGVPLGAVQQCWDATACLVYVNDPGNWTKSCAAAPCTIGVESDCPQYPPLREPPDAPWGDVVLAP